MSKNLQQRERENEKLERNSIYTIIINKYLNLSSYFQRISINDTSAKKNVKCKTITLSRKNYSFDKSEVTFARSSRHKHRNYAGNPVSIHMHVPSASYLDEFARGTCARVPAVTGCLASRVSARVELCPVYR